MNPVIPVLRVFDYQKTLEFYVDWLGFKIDWEHRFNPTAPLYMQISLGEVIIHLSEHHGDCSPGAKIIIQKRELRAYHKLITAKKYTYNRPGFEENDWEYSVEVNDPFYNRLHFSQPK